MAHTLTEPAEIPSGSPVRPRGVLAVAQPAPEGWELGGIQTSAVCPNPIVRDKCLSFTAESVRPTLAEFPAFLIEQGSECSTLSGGDRATEARNALSDSTDYALGLTLRTGEANDGAPSLGDATSVAGSPFDDVVLAVAALECAAAEAGHGQFTVLHASPGAAAFLAAAGMVDDNGLSPAGSPWIISSGYGCAEDDGSYRIWATGRVWAAAGQFTIHDAVNNRTNNREAWASRPAIVGFNTCINLTATFTTGPSNP